VYYDLNVTFFTNIPDNSISLTLDRNKRYCTFWTHQMRKWQTILVVALATTAVWSCRVADAVPVSGPQFRQVTEKITASFRRVIAAHQMDNRLVRSDHKTVEMSTPVSMVTPVTHPLLQSWQLRLPPPLA
jgi:hypothetical protein